MIPRKVRPATERDIERIWPAVSAEGFFASREAFEAGWRLQPWTVRVVGRGQAVLLGRWKAHLDVLAMRRVWASERTVPSLVADARLVAAEHRFGRLMSPLLPEILLEPYLRSGMRVMERVVALQADPPAVPRTSPVDVIVREGTVGDVPAVAKIDAEAFGDFWRWDAADLLGMVERERLAVACDETGRVIGYTLATLGHGTVTLTRLAVRAEARRRGVGRALLGACAEWAASGGAHTISLCTQVGNAASRSLYTTSGFAELEHAYAFAVADVAEEAGR